MAFVPLSVFAEDGPVPAVLPARAALPLLNEEQLNELVGPIALHPDALVALILPAATVPSDIVLAARYLAAGGLIAKVEDQSWDDSVKALARYPDLVQWMDENLAWTKQLGETFDNQPADLMKAIQRMRAKARAAGTLQDTAQQRVEVTGGIIRIVPAEREVIYVPYYDPEVVYVGYPNRFGNTFLTFSTGFAAGYWLAYDFNWNVNTIWVINRDCRERYWHDRRDWHYHPPVVIDRPHHRPPDDCHEWRPGNRDRDRRPSRVAYSPSPDFVVRPGAPAFANPNRTPGDRSYGDSRRDDRRDDGNRNRYPNSSRAGNDSNRRRDSGGSVSVAPTPPATPAPVAVHNPPATPAPDSNRQRYSPKVPTAQRPTTPAPNPTSNAAPSENQRTVERRQPRNDAPVAYQPRNESRPANTPPAQSNTESRPAYNPPAHTRTESRSNNDSSSSDSSRSSSSSSQRDYSPKNPTSSPPPAPAPASRSTPTDTQQRDAD